MSRSVSQDNERGQAMTSNGRLPAKDRKRLGWLAAGIVEDYQRRTRGQLRWLTDDMRFALLCESVVSRMVAQYGNDKQSSPDELIDARAAALDYLFPDHYGPAAPHAEGDQP